MHLHDLGGCGKPPVLLLHANGFHYQVFDPLVATLQPYFHCYALDLPGHGDASESGPGCAAVGPTVELLNECVTAAGLRGHCMALGHSLGGALALAAEAAHSGLFAAIYAYEPVAGAADEALGSPERAQVTHVLSSMARRRRAEFASPEEAAARLGGKPPYSLFHPDALRGFLRHGLRQHISLASGQSSSSSAWSSPNGSLSPAAAPPPVTTRTTWALKCAPAVEAAWYQAVGEFIPVATERVRCPVLLAVGGAGGAAAGSSASTTTSKEPQQGSRAATSRQPSSGGSGGNSSSSSGGGGNIHGQLPLLGKRLAERLPTARLVEFDRLQHFGPMEAPGAVGGSAREFFLSVLAGGVGSGGKIARSRL